MPKGDADGYAEKRLVGAWGVVSALGVSVACGSPALTTLTHEALLPMREDAPGSLVPGAGEDLRGLLRRDTVE